MDSKRMLMICDEAMRLSQEQRQDFLLAVCEGDEELLAAARRILQAIDDSGTFLKLPDPLEGDEY